MPVIESWREGGATRRRHAEARGTGKTLQRETRRAEVGGDVRAKTGERWDFPSPGGRSANPALLQALQISPHGTIGPFLLLPPHVQDTLDDLGRIIAQALPTLHFFSLAVPFAAFSFRQIMCLLVSTQSAVAAALTQILMAQP